MIKMRIILWMTILIAIGCGQKERMKEATRPSEIVNKMMGTNKSNRPDYAIKAPDFTLRTVQGELFKLSENRGKVIMLNFWGTWCGPCRREIPDFNKLHAKYQKDGLEIVGVTLTSGSSKNILEFMNSWDMKYTVLTDIDNNETQRVTSIYGRAIGRPITGIPTTLIIDQEGYIVKGYIGPRSEEVFYKDLQPLLSSS
jgi:peroxiredoxin